MKLVLFTCLVMLSLVAGVLSFGFGVEEFQYDLMPRETPKYKKKCTPRLQVGLRYKRSTRCYFFDLFCFDDEEMVTYTYYTYPCTLVAYGDPHYSTLDGLTFEFHGTCNYILAAKSVGDTTFRILSENYYPTESQKNHHVASPKNVWLEVYGHRVILNHDGRLIVDGIEHRMPTVIGSITEFISVYPQPGRIVISTSFGLTIIVSGLDSIELNIPEEYRGLLIGLLGNFDGYPTNDFLLPNGEEAPDAITLGNAWKDDSHSNPGCDDGQISEDGCTTEEEIADVRSLCDGLSDPKGIFSACHNEIPPEPFQTSCEYDMCHDYGDEAFLCDAFEMYASVCAYEGIIVDWRTEDFCSPNCMTHGHYEVSTSPCMNTCATPDIASTCEDDTFLPISGCVCDEGYLYDNGECVKCHQCGCLTAGVYHQQGDLWYDGCTKICICTDVNKVHCVDVEGCHSDLTCQDQPDGTQECLCNPGSTCYQECYVTTDATLQSPLTTGWKIPKNINRIIAKTDGSQTEPCTAQVLVSTNQSGGVDGVTVSVGLNSMEPDEYACVFKFGYQGNPSFEKKCIACVTEEGDLFEMEAFSAVVTDTNLGYMLNVECNTVNLMTFIHADYYTLEVEDPNNWTEICYDF